MISSESLNQEMDKVVNEVACDDVKFADRIVDDVKRIRLTGEEMARMIEERNMACLTVGRMLNLSDDEIISAFFDWHWTWSDHQKVDSTPECKRFRALDRVIRSKLEAHDQAVTPAKPRMRANLTVYISDHPTYCELFVPSELYEGCTINYHGTLYQVRHISLSGYILTSNLGRIPWSSCDRMDRIMIADVVRSRGCPEHYPLEYYQAILNWMSH